VVQDQQGQLAQREQTVLLVLVVCQMASRVLLAAVLVMVVQAALVVTVILAGQVVQVVLLSLRLLQFPLTI
jgi:hypothetical protein